MAKTDSKNSSSSPSHEPINRGQEGHTPDNEGDVSRAGETANKNENGKQSVDPVAEEKAAVLALEAKLPRPSWYSSDDEDESDVSSVEVLETSEMRAKQPGGLPSLVIYTVLCFISFVFNLTSSCPIPWMRGKDGRQYGVWRAKKGGQPDLKVNNIHDCSDEMQYWQTAAAFSVMATFASFGATISGILLCVGHGHIGASLILAFYGMSFSIVSWSVVVALFHYFRCGKGVFANGIAHLDAGFALTLIAWVFLSAALVVLLLHFGRYYTRSIHAGHTPIMRFVYVGLLCIVAIFTSVGPAHTQWSKSFPLIDCRVSVWHIELYDKQTRLQTSLGRAAYQCSTFIRRMKVVAAFNILGNIFLGLAIVTGLIACHSPAVVRWSNFWGWTAAVFSLVAWLVLVISRHGHLCTGSIESGQSLWHDMGYNGVPSGVHNAQIEYSGYSMRAGFALMVTGWALNVVSTLLNCFL